LPPQSLIWATFPARLSVDLDTHEDIIAPYLAKLWPEKY
jgi:hypothetical protein